MILQVKSPETHTDRLTYTHTLTHTTHRDSHIYIHTHTHEHMYSHMHTETHTNTGKQIPGLVEKRPDHGEFGTGYTGLPKAVVVWVA